MGSITPPAAFASVQGPGGKSIVIYVDDQKNIKVFKQNEKGESMYRNAPKNPPERLKEAAKKSQLWNRAPYNEPGLASLTAKVVSVNSADLSVVALTSGDNDLYQIRIYYASDVDTHGDGKSYLSELCLDMDPVTFKPKKDSDNGTENGVWFAGNLDSAKFEVAKDSPISAHLVTGKTPADSAIKVYYFPKNPIREAGYGTYGRPAVAWITLDYKDGWLSTESGI